ncbi:MAG TPA: DUF1592 domain-containing protein [Roseimicrobium sp.]|nr:DUF1592 domain-containing protein [Roseimicrobium sp.]
MTYFLLRLSGVFATAAVFLSLGSPFAIAADRRAPVGSEVYRKQCASCHGRNGEGVKGKYDEALHGDWSVQKLSRYIDKAMPEDAPEKVNATEADVVARYIYDAFYSREARDRNNPARVELVHLTNRQYVNTIADLIGSFTGPDPVPVKERGLKASYFNSRGFNKRVIERIDPQVSFDYGTNSPDKEKIGVDEFAMRWSGSLLAEETGTYEFIVKSPIGMRFWVNNPGEPVIDAWVASSQTEYRVNVKLIGGRLYPLALDCFKFKDKTASVSLEWRPPHGAQQVIPSRNLLPMQAKPTFIISTPFPPDDSSVGYERGMGVSKAWDEATTQAAIEVANHVVKNLDRLTKSKATDTNRTAKVEAFCEEFAQAAFRQPLNAEQKRQYVSSRFHGSSDIEQAVKRVVLLSLKSPQFLYLGIPPEGQKAFEVASRVSFGLWDSLPDRELLKAAAEGRLETKEQVAAQAQRMMADSRTKSKVQYFLHHWLQMDRVEDLSKDATLYPGFSPEIIGDLRTSLNLFLDDVVWGAKSDYRQLLLSDYLYVNDRLGKFYGLNVPETNDFVQVKLDPKQRSGVVTHPYLLSAFSYQRSTSPIHRGVFLTRNIIGRSLRPPPVAVAFKDAEFSPHLSMREKVTELTKPQACQACHAVINPLGFSLEMYDAVGRFRTSDNGRAIDAISEYITDDGEKVHLNGARDLAEFAVGSDLARSGFIEQLFHQIVKQPIMAYGPGVLDNLRKSFEASGYNIQKLVVEIVSVSALHEESRTAINRKKT